MFIDFIIITIIVHKFIINRGRRRENCFNFSIKTERRPTKPVAIRLIFGLLFASTNCITCASARYQYYKQIGYDSAKIKSIFQYYKSYSQFTLLFQFDFMILIIVCEMKIANHLTDWNINIVVVKLSQCFSLRYLKEQVLYALNKYKKSSCLFSRP